MSDLNADSKSLEELVDIIASGRGGFQTEEEFKAAHDQAIAARLTIFERFKEQPKETLEKLGEIAAGENREQAWAAMEQIFERFKEQPKESAEVLCNSFFKSVDSAPYFWGFRAKAMLEFLNEHCEPGSFNFDEDKAILYFEKTLPYSAIRVASKEEFFQKWSDDCKRNVQRYYNVGGEMRLNIDPEDLLSALTSAYCDFLAKFGGKKSIDKLFDLMLNSPVHVISCSASNPLWNEDTLQKAGNLQEYSDRMRKCLEENPQFGDRFDADLFDNNLSHVRIMDGRLDFAVIFYYVDRGKAPFSKDYERLLIHLLKSIIKANYSEGDDPFHYLNNADLSMYYSYGGKEMENFFAERLLELEQSRGKKTEKAIPEVKAAMAEIKKRMAEREKTAFAIKKMGKCLTKEQEGKNKHVH